MWSFDRFKNKPPYFNYKFIYEYMQLVLAPWHADVEYFFQIYLPDIFAIGTIVGLNFSWDIFHPVYCIYVKSNASNS